MDRGDGPDVEEIQIVNPGVTTTDSNQKSRQLRWNRCTAKLTEETFETLFKNEPVLNYLTSCKMDYRTPKIAVVLRGTLSQFDTARAGSSQLLPSIANDCCQTFSAICAALVCACGCVKNLREIWQPSSVNYILYVSAWLHQITSPAWRDANKSRPNVRDINKLLKLRTTFPVSPDDEFDIVFYSDSGKIVDMIESLCTSANLRKRERSSDDVAPSTCGYLIVSGDYTISVVCVPHDTPDGVNPGYALILCDSHGTAPWSKSKASLLLVTVIDNVPDGSYLELPNGARAYNIKTGCRHFCEILFAILEDNRKEAWRALQGELKKIESHKATTPVPYMTWTPVKRWSGKKMTLEELKQVIDYTWLPSCLEHPDVLKEKKNFFPGDDFLRPCFLGVT